MEKVTTKKTPERLPVHSFATLLADLGTICANQIAPTNAELDGFCHPHHHADPASAPGIRAPRRLAPCGLPVVMTSCSEDPKALVTRVRATRVGGTSA